MGSRIYVCQPLYYSVCRCETHLQIGHSNITGYLLLPFVDLAVELHHSEEDDSWMALPTKHGVGLTSPSGTVSKHRAVDTIKHTVDDAWGGEGEVTVQCGRRGGESLVWVEGRER